jgi:hypothetical protein
MRAPALGFRWTSGNVSDAGFEALRLSICGAWRLFGWQALYGVCVNGLSTDEARQRTGAVPATVQWHRSASLPQCLAPYLGDDMADGVAWKLAPLRLFPERFEVALDNDCILWDLPAAMHDWLDDAERCRCLIAADDILAHGAFTELTRREPRNTGIRGLPPHYDLEAALHEVLERHPVRLIGELDEQGLQVVALDLGAPAHVVATEDVSICSPFWPRRPTLGRCGAHFVGLNCRTVPWDYYDRPATEWIMENWACHRRELYERVGLAIE